MTGRRTLVTGASGFIGSHVVDRLLAVNTHVTALVRPERRLPERWRHRVSYVECSDWSGEGIRSALRPHDFDVVFHLAAYGTHPADRDPDQMLRVNVDLPTALVHLCAEHRARLVMAGTVSEYQTPATRTPLTEHSLLETSKIYGASKAAGGLVASAIATSLGVKLRILRLFKVYGPGEAPHRLLPSLVTGLSKGHRVPLSAGTQVLDFVYVEDVVEALIRADADMQSNSRLLTATWNVCTGAGHSVRTFTLLVAEALGAKVDLLGFGELPMRADDEHWSVGSCERLSAALGWHPTYDLETGVRAAVTACSSIGIATT